MKTSLKLLMVGNSFSISVLNHLPQVAKSLGLGLDIASLYIGGCSLERHLQNAINGDPGFKPYRFDRVANCEAIVSNGVANVTEALCMDDWDVVTIQQASHLSWRLETYEPFAKGLIDAIRELAPRAEIVVQETWSYTPWDGRLAEWVMSADEMYARLHSAYGTFAKSYGFRVIPMGTAVQLFRKELPVVYADNSFGGDPCGGRGGFGFVRDDSGRWMPSPQTDVFHLHERGEYLQALVWAAALFGADIRKCDYKPDFIIGDQHMLDVMRESAMRAVGLQAHDC